MFCRNCGAQIDDNAVYCTSCGATVNEQAAQPVANADAKSKLVAGLLGIFLGGLGIHNFYLGNTGRAIGQIAVTFVTCGAGSLWGFIEGILILCGNINTDAQGNPLKD